MDSTRYQELFKTNGLSIVEDRAAVMERDRLQREIEGYKGRTAQFETVMEVVYKQVGIDYGYDIYNRARVLLDRVLAYKAGMAELEAELIKKDMELQALRQQVVAKPSTDDTVRPIGGEDDRTVHGADTDDVVGGGGG